jgi:hypothetical protein
MKILLDLRLSESDSTKTLLYKEFLYMLGIIICLMILTLNITILFRIICPRRLRTPMNMLLVNLHLADLLLGAAFLIPSIIHWSIVRSQKRHDMAFYNSIYSLLQNNNSDLVFGIYMPIVTSMLVSMLTLTALAINKYINILHPYISMRLAGNMKRNLTLMVLFIWLLSITVCLIPFWWYNDPHSCTGSNRLCKQTRSKGCMFHRVFQFRYFMVFTVVCVVCSGLILTLYASIYIFAHKEHVALSRRSNSLNIYKRDKFPANSQMQNTPITHSESARVDHSDPEAEPFVANDPTNPKSVHACRSHFNSISGISREIKWNFLISKIFKIKSR